MFVSTLCRILSVSALMVTLSIAATANAASIYTVTDLGSNFTLQQDSSGSVHSVTSGDGIRTYTFEKSPVSHSTDPSGEMTDNGRYPITTISSKGGSISTQQVPRSLVTIFEVTLLPNWSSPYQPVNDINSSGYAVGTLGYNIAALASPASLGKGGYPEDLNQEISNSLNVRLTSALTIDDLGNIIAKGTLDGTNRDFLLTPNGPPIPSPEPSTLAFLSVGITALAIRSAHRRWMPDRTQKA